MKFWGRKKVFELISLISRLLHSPFFSEIFACVINHTFCMWISGIYTGTAVTTKILISSHAFPVVCIWQGEEGWQRCFWLPPQLLAMAFALLSDRTYCLAPQPYGVP